jgi:hypothetical protein
LKYSVLAFLSIFSASPVPRIACTLKPSPAKSNTEALARVTGDALAEHEVDVEHLRVVDHDFPREPVTRRGPFHGHPAPPPSSEETPGRKP